MVALRRHPAGTSSDTPATSARTGPASGGRYGVAAGAVGVAADVVVSAEVAGVVMCGGADDDADGVDAAAAEDAVVVAYAW